ncbi:YciI family protein [Cellulomonas fimi]|uniref:YCII-related protein n=1 Tax=Cellulomonas fimi (strain ATCC 484 / DSM 20113 / JCM 1341 / CCUG 24087 / LMG 16345 / NBRC 15513 / NCIMB 8980 / NCTC 7547 / NRS-133) TaxID=590998 RepID=F4H023_CELFA|nr:YciI family protein [Cellulomonas fimi]AEE44945.1 YCII-related protein [Cellulomonas fimi ATCC 484]NNH07232.1 hypothetical protein [Cellulomonas fimi]VEH27758.1 Uncharacterized protein conserved in bacteria [Cellulomonas fimi]
MSQRYVVLLRGDEAAWDAADEQTRAAAYEDHGAFAEECARRGHVVVGGEELQAAASALVVRRTPAADDGRGELDDVTVTEGPYVETAEQLGGYYVVETDDVQDLARLVRTIMWPGDVVELRPVAS